MSIIDGFHCVARADDEDSAGNASVHQLQWYCAPDAWQPSDDKDDEEGRYGSWSLCKGGKELCLVPPSKKDFWRRTYYEPILVKDDGPVLYATLDAAKDKQYTVSTSFALTAYSQFDQAGLVLRYDHEHWVKTGIEVVDQQPRLSCVVTNIYSDWSTQRHSDFAVAGNSGGIVVKATIRLHCYLDRDSIVVESFNSQKQEWEFVRIAHLSRSTFDGKPAEATMERAAAFQGPAPPPGKLWVGVFGCCPVHQKGDCKVYFDSFCPNNILRCLLPQRQCLVPALAPAVVPRVLPEGPVPCTIITPPAIQEGKPQFDHKAGGS